MSFVEHFKGVGKISCEWNHFLKEFFERSCEQGIVSYRLEETSKEFSEFTAVQIKNGTMLHMSSVGSIFVGLVAVSNSLVILREKSVPFTLPALSGHVTFANIIQLGAAYYVVAGDCNGLINVFEFDCSLDFEHTPRHHLVAVFHCKQSVKFIVHQSTQLLHRLTDNILYLWVVCDDAIRFIGSKLPVTSNNYQDSLSKKMQQYFAFACGASSDELGQCHYVESLESGFGPSSCLAFHYFKSNNTYNRIKDVPTMSVFTIDCRLVLSYAEKIRKGDIPPPSALLPVGPVLVVPLSENSSTTSSSSSSSALSFFGLGKRTVGSSSSGAGSVGASSYVSVVPSASIRAAFCVDYTVPLEVACAEGVFGFSVQVLNLATNTITTGTISSLQTKVVDSWRSIGPKVFAEPDSLVDLRTTSSVEHRDLASGTISGSGAAAVLYLDATQQSALQNISLWRACLGLKLLPPHRLLLVQQLVQAHDDKYAALTQYGSALSADQVQQKSQQEKVLGRLVLMESALALGLSSHLAQYILSYNTHSNGYDIAFLLTDVKRVHEWAVRTSLQSSSQLARLASVQAHLEGMAKDLSENFIIPLLLCRDSTHSCRTEVGADGQKIKISSDVSVALTLELQSHILVCDGLKNVLDALLQRKLMSLGEDAAAAAQALGSSRLNVSSTTTSADVLQGVVEEAILELKVRQLEVKSLSQVLAVLNQMCTTPTLSFNCLHAAQLTSAGQRSSLYNLSMKPELSVPAHLPPEVSVGPSLMDELCSRLGSSLFPVTRVPNTDDLAALSHSVCELLFLPVSGLGDIFKNISNTDTVEEIESRLGGHVNISHSVIVQFLLSVFLLSRDNVTGPQIRSCGLQLCNAAGIPLHLSRGLLALFAIDQDLETFDAVREICDSNILIIRDDIMLVVTVKRLLRGGQMRAARSLLTHLCTINHPFVETKLGVVCFAGCISVEESWQFVWHESRRLCTALLSRNDNDSINVQEYSECRREVTLLLCRWSVSHNELIALLNAPVDDVELSAVIEFLMQLAYQEISQGAVDAPGVDLCVSYMLRHQMVEDAERVHQDHVKGLRSKSLEAVYAASGAADARKMLLDAHKRVPRATGFTNSDITGCIVNPELSQTAVGHTKLVSAFSSHHTWSTYESLNNEQDLVRALLAEQGMLHLVEPSISESTVAVTGALSEGPPSAVRAAHLVGQSFAKRSKFSLQDMDVQ